MYSWVRAWLFRQDAEKSHDFTMGLLRRYAHTPLSLTWRQQVEPHPVRVMGIDFPNPVGLAAGLDKNGEAIDAFSQMGFGFIEVGTVTPKPQPGNPKPRMFRIPERTALINRMGFNNKGVDYLVEQIKAARYRGILGINIGKNKDTPEDQAVNDYLHCMRKVYPYASYIAVNISSPNTPGLRAFQHGNAFDDLLAALKELQYELHGKHGRYVPLAVKIAPDLSDEGIADIAQALLKHQIDGVIATNTTLSREQVAGLPNSDEAGGLSGSVLFDASTRVVQLLHSHLGDKIPVIGVGGIDSPERAKAKLAAGAQLIQIYTGFIYEGPTLVQRIVKNL
ncbi:dihydroorotate dehydrogenase [Pseudidiomarina salinarum]|uniref:Dihydroorotate dehydrogenase (quinone) n=1 Tax=Pseudidiomarina salinarum TaxID=435908 RepID=A0A094LAK2_9GAMM|nr:quinone-dependent dihydroorotate dehydrogenase [Pseudidiomarina salinarum]KFZ31848.1 dihydroorotate dehydrogenase [Pseudidiomarina salinarum]RUO70380.1 quinone-dependent dihydroorotate dehydrogenase [Pseudidiomarina salinarum]